ncbi:hypothetical protein HYT91_02820 [Candidatus Pacearchaeota archaeon]|nr:hypothetical protein [Candidatus Pacearchaeota archaeon]
MTKIKILGISKNEHRSEYLFPKEQKLFNIIREMLKKLNFENRFDNIESFGRPANEGGETMWDKENDIKEYNERIINFESKDYSMDIIFFSKRVVLIFNYKEDKQQEIAKILDKFILEED